MNVARHQFVVAAGGVPIGPVMGELHDHAETAGAFEQLVDVGILIGTDYNIGGIPGVGPKTALKLIQKYSKLENIDQLQEHLSNIPYEEIRELFLEPKVANVTNNDIKFEPVDYDKVVEFLSMEKNFSPDRINSALQKVQNSEKNKNQSLEKWF